MKFNIVIVDISPRVKNTLFTYKLQIKGVTLSKKSFYNN